MNALISVFALFTFATSFTMDQKKLDSNDTVFAFDLDGTFNTKPDHNALVKTYGNAKKVASFTWMLSLKDKLKIPFYVPRIRTIVSKVKEINGTTFGASNVAHQAVSFVKDEWKDNFSQYTDQMTNLMINPEPVPEMTQMVGTLKERFGVIGATNQDDVQHKYYKEKMMQKDVDINGYFHGMATYRSYKYQDMKDESVVIDADHNWYSSKHPKPTPQFFDIVKAVAKKVKPQCKVVIFVDDKDEFIKGVNENEKDTKDQSVSIIAKQFTGVKDLRDFLVTNKYLSK